MKARTLNALWRAFRPGSVGQKVIRAVVYTVIVIILILASSLVAITI